MAENGQVSNYNGQVEWRKTAMSVFITIKWNGAKRQGQ